MQTQVSSDSDFVFVLNIPENTEEVSTETIDEMTDLKNALQSVSTENAMEMLQYLTPMEEKILLQLYATERK